jgi:hypothetical protein
MRLQAARALLAPSQLLHALSRHPESTRDRGQGDAGIAGIADRFADFPVSLAGRGFRRPGRFNGTQDAGEFGALHWESFAVVQRLPTGLDTTLDAS